VARAWMEYVKTGAVDDTTPPPAPFAVKSVATPEGTVELTWDSEADLESGLKQFIVQRDGRELARVPEKPAGRFGRPLFQGMTYHDTPEKPLQPMRYTDSTAGQASKAVYRVIAVNAVGLESEPSAQVTP